MESARWLAPGCALAAICLGLALQISSGVLQPAALLLVVVALAVLAGAAITERPTNLAGLDAVIMRLLGTTAFVAHLLCLFIALPGLHLQLDQGGLVAFHWGVGMLAVVLVSIVVSGSAASLMSARWAPLQIVLLLTAHCALGVWLIHRSPDPPIDVHVFHQQAIAAFRSGVNPYAITMPDIYHNNVYYGPGVSVNGRLQFGFPYFPMSLLLSMAGQGFGGDPRYAQLAAIELAALLMAFTRRRGFGLFAAALYLTTPRIFFVLEHSWTEPFLVLGASAVIFAACRQRRLVPWLFGAFIALKQYLVFALPAAVFLVQGPVNRRTVAAFLAKAAIVGAVVTLPFVVWNPGAFWTSVVTLQFRQPFRTDALSVLAWWVSLGHRQPPVLMAFVAASAASAVALWRVPRTPAGFGAAVAITFLAFFVFNKQAFANYYFFVIGALYASVAAWHPAPVPR